MTYMQNKLGAIVIEYFTINGDMPERFSIALNSSTTNLGHRGDVNGDSVAYYRVSSNEFYFISYGTNNRYEGGGGDDVVVAYIAGVWGVKGAVYVRDADQRILRSAME